MAMVTQGGAAVHPCWEEPPSSLLCCKERGKTSGMGPARVLVCSYPSVQLRLSAPGHGCGMFLWALTVLPQAALLLPHHLLGLAGTSSAWAVSREESAVLWLYPALEAAGTSLSLQNIAWNSFLLFQAPGIASQELGKTCVSFSFLHSKPCLRNI